MFRLLLQIIAGINSEDIVLYINEMIEIVKLWHVSKYYHGANIKLYFEGELFENYEIRSGYPFLIGKCSLA